MNLFSMAQQGHIMFQKALHGTPAQFCCTKLLFSCAADAAQTFQTIQPMQWCLNIKCVCSHHGNIYHYMLHSSKCTYSISHVATWLIKKSRHDLWCDSCIITRPIRQFYYSCKDRQLSQKKWCPIVGYQVYNPAAFVKENTFSTQQKKLFSLEKFNINKSHSSQ